VSVNTNSRLLYIFYGLLSDGYFGLNSATKKDPLHGWRSPCRYRSGQNDRMGGQCQGIKLQTRIVIERFAMCIPDVVNHFKLDVCLISVP
jgi:hypothetical protein